MQPVAAEVTDDQMVAAGAMVEEVAVAHQELRGRATPDPQEQRERQALAG